MFAFLAKFLLIVRSRLRSQARLQAEILVLRQQLLVLSRKSLLRARLRNLDRLILVWLYRLFPSILDAITVVKPETVLRWHRRGFRAYWHWKSRRAGGRPKIDREIRALIRRMTHENPWWGAPRTHGELLMLGIEVAQSTVAKYGSARATDLTRLEDLPTQPHRRHRVHRLIRGALHLVQAALRSGDSRPPAQEAGSDKRDHQSDRRVDRWSGH